MLTDLTSVSKDLISYSVWLFLTVVCLMLLLFALWIFKQL